MTNYQRIAMLVLRLAGTAWVVFLIFMWCIYFLEVALGVEVQRYPTHTIIGNAGYVAFGVLVIAFSNPLGRLVARGLE